MTAENVRPLREGFVAPEAPVAAAAGAPPELELPTPPQAPLPSQKELNQPPPEPPLSEADIARAQIVANPDTWPVTVQLLYKPIRTEKGEVVNSLTFREPTAGEINRIGNPTRILWDGEVIIEERKMTFIMAALCGLLPPTLNQLDPRDWNSCAWKLRSFFLPDPRAYSATISFSTATGSRITTINRPMSFWR